MREGLGARIRLPRSKIPERPPVRGGEAFGGAAPGRRKGSEEADTAFPLGTGKHFLPYLQCSTTKNNNSKNRNDGCSELQTQHRWPSAFA